MSTGVLPRAVAPDSHGGAVAERLMQAALVVECEVIADAGPGFATIGVAFEIDVLVFQRAPQAFDEHIVHPAAAPVHRDLYARLDQHAGEVRAGELTALIGVEDFAAAVSGQRFLQRRHARHEASIVFDNRQESTARLAQSITATR